MSTILNLNDITLKEVFTTFLGVSLDSIYQNKGELYYYNSDLPELVIYYPETQDKCGFIKKPNKHLSYQTSIDKYLRSLVQEKLEQIHLTI